MAKDREILESFEDGCINNNRTDMLDEGDYAKNSINPKDISCGSGKLIYGKCVNNHSFESKLCSRTSRINSHCPYCSERKILPGYNDFETKCHQNGEEKLLKEGDFKKNIIKPCEVSYKSHAKVWGICEHGHSFHQQICSRTYHNSECPICRKHSQSSLAEQTIHGYVKKYFPDTLNTYKEFGFELDVYIPSKATAIEYDGNKGHRDKKDKDEEKNKKCIDAGIRLIRIREPGLPTMDNCECIHRKSDSGMETLQKSVIDLLNLLGIKNPHVDVKNDRHDILNSFVFGISDRSLLAQNPELSKEGHPTKNGKLRPEDVYAGSDEKVGWLGPCGHEGETRIKLRARKGHGCPYCSTSNATVLIGFNDLKTKYPQLASEGDYDKNKPLKPEDFTGGSNRKVGWIGNKCGHSFEQVIKTRVHGHGCPVCDKKQGRLILNIETGKTYRTLKEAALSCGKNTNGSVISECCLKKQASAYGYHGEYINKDTAD